MPSASPGLRRNQAPSRPSAHVNLDRLSRDIRDRAPATRGLVPQFRVEIVREFHRGALHGMPAYLDQPRTSIRCWFREARPGVGADSIVIKVFVIKVHVVMRENPGSHQRGVEPAAGKDDAPAPTGSGIASFSASWRNAPAL